MRAIWLAWLLASGPPSAPRIANGVEASTCQLPSVVILRDAGSGTQFCSGTLIHPELVLFAAHCIDPQEGNWKVGAVGFGESGWLPQRSVGVTRCEMHPGYDSADQDLDLAWCRLEEAVEDVPIVPLAMGCEAKVLAPGETVTIAGFGASEGIYDAQGGVEIAGQGPKRYTQMVVDEVDLAGNDLLLIGDDTGACFGDSGGPALVRLPDGQWRVVGAASTVHPDTQYMVGDNVCTYGSAYELAFTQAKWLEDASGVDLTPCHDADGTWNPGPGCREFPLDPWAEGGSWSDGCAGGPTTDWVATCGPAYPDVPEPGTDLAPPDSGTGGPEEGDSGLVGRGCGCGAVGDDPWTAGLWLVPMLIVFQNRKRSPSDRPKPRSINEGAGARTPNRVNPEKVATRRGLKRSA